MKAGMAISDRSLDEGLYKDTIQRNTSQQRGMSMVTNILQTTVGGSEYSVGAYE
jgi:hypothetical protein